MDDYRKTCHRAVNAAKMAGVNLPHTFFFAQRLRWYREDLSQGSESAIHNVTGLLENKIAGKLPRKKKRQAYLISCIRTFWVEEYGAAAFVLIHQTRVLEMSNQGCFPLDSGISKWCHLLTVKLLPLFTIKSLKRMTKWFRIAHQCSSWIFYQSTNLASHTSWSKAKIAIIASMQ